MAVLGMWMWPQSVETRGAEKTAEYCARAGVTDLFFLTKGLAGTTAYHGGFAPRFSSRDLLRELLDSAHRRGIRVHAWLTSACDAHYKAQHPESGRCHFIRGKDRELISLADEGYLRYMERIVGELCRNDEIDGLHLDYIRYNHLTYGWAQEDLARYEAEGADADRLRGCMQRMYCRESKEPNLLFEAFRAGDQDALALARARRRDVVTFARRLISAAREEKAALPVSAALMPEGAYEDLAFADLHYGQHYEDFAAMCDFALPMAYSKAYEQDAQWVRKVAEGTMKKGLKTIVGLHAYEGGTGPQLAGDLKALQEVPVEGVCLFREGAFAMAFAEGKELCLYNAMETEISHAAAENGAETVTLAEKLMPGEEKRFFLPFEAEAVRVYAGGQERSVFLTRR